MCIYIYIYIYTHKFTSKCHSPHSRSGDSHRKEMFLAPSADKQTHNYDTECSNHLSLSTLMSKGFGCSEYICIHIVLN